MNSRAWGRRLVPVGARTSLMASREVLRHYGEDAAIDVVCLDTPPPSGRGASFECDLRRECLYRSRLPPGNEGFAVNAAKRFELSNLQ